VPSGPETAERLGEPSQEKTACEHWACPKFTVHRLFTATVNIVSMVHIAMLQLLTNTRDHLSRSQRLVGRARGHTDVGTQL
jgi:hypothetical protein